MLTARRPLKLTPIRKQLSTTPWPSPWAQAESDIQIPDALAVELVRVCIFLIVDPDVWNCYGTDDHHKPHQIQSTSDTILGRIPRWRHFSCQPNK